MTILCAGVGEPHAGWVAIDELAFMLSDFFEADLLSPSRRQPGIFRRFSGRTRPTYSPLICKGGDVLMVVAHAPGDLSMIQSIPNVRQRYSQIVGFVTDSYFQAGFLPETALYDAITVTAKEDIDSVQKRFNIPVHHLYQGTDALRWTPRTLFARDINLIAFGRTPPSYHEAFCQSFHSSNSPYLYLHSPLGHINGPQVHRERGMLLKLLQRSQISLAFHMYVEPQGERPRSMMVTSRWLESLSAGCIVAGKRPISRMADEMLCWDGCTLELPDDVNEAVDAVQDLIQRYDSNHPQRLENMKQILLRHDWRYRIESLCELNGWPKPQRLGQELEMLLKRADDFL